MIRIAHIADIHWRALSRHDEYKKVFSQFVDQCREAKVDHIAVLGDIFHTKTSGLSPEYVRELTKWLLSMAKVAKVHLILGNHDGNLTNALRLDAVTPIVEAINSNDILLYKQSGIYQFEPGFNFCVFSLFDEANWNKVKPVSGEFNIACYHGPVFGAKSETDWEVHEGINVEFFNEYDLALLGDIHKTQHLGFRDVEFVKHKDDVRVLPGDDVLELANEMLHVKTRKPWISYPGSTIQQNYAESLEHGYLLWDIFGKSSYDVRFCALDNVKPFVTLEWDNNVEDLLAKANQFPNGSRFRIKTKQHISQKDITLICETLKRNKSVSEVTVKNEQVFDKSVIIKDDLLIHKTDLRQVDVICKLVKDYYGNLSLTQEEFDLLRSKISDALSIQQADDKRNIKWSLRRIKFDNVLCYGKDNVINFDKLNGIIGILAPNRSGKSSIIASIVYSLFNELDRGNVKNLHIINARKAHCYTNTVINVAGIDYVVERQTVKHESKKGLVYANTTLNVFESRDEELVDLVGEQRYDTEKVVRSLIGNLEDFKMTSLSAQNDINSQFIELGSTKRRNLISRFLDLDVFASMFEFLNANAKSLRTAAKSLQDDNSGEELQDLEQRLENTKKVYENIVLEIASTNHEILELSQKVRSTGASDVTEVHVNEKKEYIAKKKKSLSNVLETLTKTHKEEELEKLESLELESLLKVNSISKIENDLSAIRDTKQLIKQFKQKHEHEIEMLKIHERSLKLLDEVPCEDKFPTCKFIKDAHESKLKVQAQKDLTISTLLDLTEAEKKLQLFDTSAIESQYQKVSQAIKRQKEIELSTSRRETLIHKLESEKTQLESDIATAEVRLKSLEEALQSDDNIENIQTKNAIEAALVKRKSLEEKQLSLMHVQGNIQSKIETNRQRLNKKMQLLEELKIYDLLSTAFSKTGIPATIIKQQLPLINVELSKILSGFFDFTIELEVNDDNDDLNVYINYGDSRRVIELCSGMEKMIANLAIRVALINVSSLPKTDIFIIDEGFGSLDESSVEACNRLLMSLKNYFKTILFITHVDSVKDVADHLLEIVKVEKDSKVVYE